MKGKTARRSLWRPFGFALRGCWTALKEEPHMRFHLFAGAAAIAAGGLLGVDRGDWLWLAAAISFVWTSELFNTAIERAVDVNGPERHPLVAAAKDTAAGAVLVAAAFALIVGLLVLGPPLWRLLSA